MIAGIPFAKLDGITFRLFSMAGAARLELARLGWAGYGTAGVAWIGQAGLGMAGN